MLNGVPRILIIRLSAIGDVVRVLPALHCLRDTYPNAQIDWVIEEKSRDIIEGHPGLDQIITFTRPDDLRESVKEFRALCKQIRANRYDMVIDFHGIFKSGLIAGFSGAKDRYGFARPRSQEGSSLFVNHRTKLGQEVRNRMHENLALCEQFNKSWRSLDVVIDIPDDAVESSAAFIEENFAGAKRVVAIHAPVDRPEKQWPLKYFAELTDMLLSDGRFDVMLTWGPGQQDVVREVSALARRNAVIAPHTEGLKQYMALVQDCDLFVGGDTGPMHIASALDVPVVAMFGGTDPAQHSTLRPPCTMLFSERGKGKDARYLKENGPSLLAEITPDEVYDACVSIWNTVS
jgi:heptosyltransferase I